MNQEESDLQNSELLEALQALTESLYHDQPYDLVVYLQRAVIYKELGYPDLAAGDAYRALILTDEILDESFEYHEQSLEALRPYVGNLPEVLTRHEITEGVLDAEELLADSLKGLDIEQDDVPVYKLAKKSAMTAYRILSMSLLLCGCLKTAYDFCRRGLEAIPNDQELLQVQQDVKGLARRKLKLQDGEELDLSELPDQGLVRREIYPWNYHEPDRFATETLKFLNHELSLVAPKCEVRVTELPTLLETASNTDSYDNIPTNKQLGLFAIADISPGETVLDEVSMLTANNRLKESLCDACSTPLPALNAAEKGVPCGECDDIMFCSQTCHDLAQESYHSSICDKDIDTIAKDPDPKESPNALYLLLLARALALSTTQEVHPLDLKEVKYIWGDFLPPTMNAVPVSAAVGPPPIWTLPFSFAHNISGPLHVLEKMDIDIFATLEQHDLWIFNTLYAKFRGTASARVGVVDAGRRSRGPEVAAVHPLWCLANHDCDPNTQWEWGGRMRLWARERRIVSEEEVNGNAALAAGTSKGRPGGIKKGEEILNHYCDIELPVKERREWAAGSLGGWCMCDRCRREAARDSNGT